MSRVYHWTFPLPRTHTGMLLGNGVIGAMIWGEGRTLRITVGRADVWDHRGGRQWTGAMNYADLRRLLEAGDEKALRAIFRHQGGEGDPAQPMMLPLGRIELELPFELTTGSLDLDTGVCSVGDVRIELCMVSPVIHVSSGAPVRHVHAWEYVGEKLAKVGYQPPRFIKKERETGWEWAIPNEPPVAIACAQIDDTLRIGCDRGFGKAASHLHRCTATIREQNADWWFNYWQDAPRIDVPDANLRFLFDYGLYKFAGLTNPAGVAASLQGPWVEEYQTPPWSNDYHFNINVQMCYAPAYRSGKLKHLMPIFDLVWGWRERLRENARKFVGIDDGYVLSHSTDDHGQITGAFWAGTIDHGCTAWIGKMMFDYYAYSGDVDFLRQRAYPFMVGAMNVYQAMLERSGDTFALPVSVSPEYRGDAMNAWGRDASFQLACIHWLCEKLQVAAQVLGETPKPAWAQIAARLPKACVENGEIMLWRGTPLEDSHRHHSHLAALLPFEVIDPADPAWQPIVSKSVRRWIGQGMGNWSGWCMSWAAQLHMLLGHADMAQLIIEIWRRVFTNQGHGTLHDFEFPGFTVMGAGRGKDHEIMQMDAGMGVTAAIMDCFVQSHRGVHHLFAGIPKSWGPVGFENIHTEGGFVLSATRGGSIRVTSKLGGTLRFVDQTITLTRGESAVIEPRTK